MSARSNEILRSTLTFGFGDVGGEPIFDMVDGGEVWGDIGGVLLGDRESGEKDGGEVEMGDDILDKESNVANNF